MAKDLKALGSRVATARKIYGWTQKQLADDSGLTQGMISNIEAGKGGNTSLATVQALAKSLRVTAAFLLGEDDENFSVKIITRESDEAEKLADLLTRFDIDEKRKAICKLALTAQTGDIDYMYNTILAPYLEGIEGTTTNQKKPSAG